MNSIQPGQLKVYGPRAQNLRPFLFRRLTLRLGPCTLLDIIGLIGYIQHVNVWPDTLLRGPYTFLTL